MTNWRVSVTPERLAALRSSEAFAEALTLARVANQLRSGLAIGRAHGPLEGSSHERIRSAITLLLSGVIAEALPVLERSGKHFRHLPSFQESIRPILSDPAIANLRQQWLSPLRNKAVFHNDREVSALGLANYAAPEPQSFARGSSDDFMDLYYPLADVVALSYVFGTSESELDPKAFLEQFAGSTIVLVGRMCEAIDAVLGEACSEWGFRAEESGEPAG